MSFGTDRLTKTEKDISDVCVVPTIYRAIVIAIESLELVIWIVVRTMQAA